MRFSRGPRAPVPGCLQLPHTGDSRPLDVAGSRCFLLTPQPAACQGLMGVPGWERHKALM